LEILEMKKSLVALAVLASTSAAFAQSSVTLFGIVDAAYARTSGNGVTRTGITNSGLNSSRLGFRGTEDLGGGLKAGFWLEGQLFNDSGEGSRTTCVVAGATVTTAGTQATCGPQGFNFQRRSYVSLQGGFGEIRLGREYTPTFWNTTVYDPFGTNGVGQAMSPAMLGAPVRANNSINYLMAANGLEVHGMLAFGEQPSNAANSKEGNYQGIRVGYVAGPISAHFATSKTKAAASANDISTMNVGLAYNLGFVRPMFTFGNEKTDLAKISYTQLGATAPVGQGQFRVAYSRYNRDMLLPANDWTKFAIGYGYDLSKRTQVYGTYAKVSNSGLSTQGVNNNGLTQPRSATDLVGATVSAPGGGSTGLEIGIRHSF
jgi:predicted porin